MASLKTLQLISSKLGLCENDKVLSKAAEFERLLQNKNLSGSNLTDTGKSVICLDLAALFYGIDLDLKLAVKFSGLKSPNYVASRKMIENLLELNSERLTIKSLCFTLECTGVQTLSEKILQDYQTNSKMDLDLNLPQYVCMAVYQACRLNKIKVSKSKLVEKSRLKTAQWTKLEVDWSKFVDVNFVVASKKKGRPKKEDTVEDEPDIQMDTQEIKKDDIEPQLEPYADWKRRMLEIAYSELKQLDYKDVSSPRRSLRKTPQKVSPPCKDSLRKTHGVRLLFPLLQ